MITMIRKFIESLYGHMFDGALASRVGIAVHELMDNAARCAHRGEVTMIIEVTDTAIEVCTRNRARPQDIAALGRTMDAMQSHDDALSYYLGLMKRTASRKDISGLGLGRIWAEADMALSYQASADTVLIRARMPLGRLGSES
jgi:anti-sigma regulatory factor (Ser/Thr protein kinase)